MAAPNCLLSLEGVTKNYESSSQSAGLPVLKGITLRIRAGESLAIIGPSGSGKSTLLNIIGTLDHPTAGKVILDGADLTGLDEIRLAETRNQSIGFIFQGHHLLPQCSVLENVLVPVIPLKKSALRDGAEDRARRLLDRVGLGSRLHHKPGQLSGGEKQRAAVVRALINQPKLLLADEPTGALDRASAENLGQILVDLNREQGVTLIVVTHALDLARRMGKAFELRDGLLAETAA